MSKTLANLRAQTRTYLDEAVQADWTDTEVDREINSSYLKLYTAAVAVYEDYYSVKAQSHSTALTQEYALPSNFWKMRRVEINYKPSSSDSVPQRALPESIDSVFKQLSSSVSTVGVMGNPAYYLRGNNIGFLPVPTETTTTGTKPITIWYIKTITELSAAGDEIDIPFADRYAFIISLDAAGTLLRKGQQEETAARGYLAEADVERDKMAQELEDRVADDSKKIIDTQGDDMDFS